MKVTSKECSKMLDTLKDKKSKLIMHENSVSTYNAAVGENVEDLRPDYDFYTTQKEIDAIDSEIMRIKHLLNLFNSSTRVDDSGLTIDQVLVKIPQLISKRNKLYKMMSRVSKERSQIIGNIIDYSYTSYDPFQAEKMYYAVTDEIANLQLALDKVNTTVTFEI